MDELELDKQELEEHEELEKQENPSEHDFSHNPTEYEDPFDSFMFGPRRGRSHKNMQQESYQNPYQIDYIELMNNIDTLMVSVNNLKPLFQKIYPAIEQIWKKK